MPQPLSKIVHGDIHDFVIAPNAALQEPELAVLIAQAISICSESDYYLGRTLIDMLGPQAAPAFAMYDSLSWGYSKTQALRAAAAMVFEAETYKLFQAILKIYGQDQNQRNRFAHWIWCYSKQAAGYIILLNPLQALRWKIKPHVRPGVVHQVVEVASSSGIAEASCYSKSELENIVQTFTDTICMIETFRELVAGSDASKAQMREHLTTQPRMIEALRQLGKPIQTPPAEHHEPPVRKPPS